MREPRGAVGLPSTSPFARRAFRRAQARAVAIEVWPCAIPAADWLLCHNV